MARSKEGFTSFLYPKDLLAASAKCRMCNYLVNRLKSRSTTISLDAKVVVNVRYYKFKQEADAWLSVDTLEIRIKFDGEDSPWTVTPLGTGWSILAHRDDPAATEIKWSPVNYNIDSSVEQAKAWIEQCELHEHCPELRVPQLPTRVLDISNGKVRLHVPYNERHHYCALSYSWGGPQPIRTLVGNIENHKAGIAISDLPQTIQDAIKFSRQLGIKYLWIDSLCIMQDSVEDKHREIAKMAGIYQNALATIAATSTSRCTDGFLSKRVQPEREILIEDLPWSCDDGSFGKVSLHWQFWHRVDQEPLNQRAWTLQERLLSPRVLSSGSHQLAWECQTARYTDGGNPRSVYDMGINRLKSYIFSPLTASTIEKSPQALFLHYTWTDAVMDLSRRKITEESDKLPAISGIAQQMHLVTGDRYLAGLWKASLHFELMWLQDAAAEDFHHAKRPTAYRAPSWSWASVEGTVTFSGPFEEKNMVAEVIHCEVIPVDPSNVFGAVSGGHLVIRGPLRSLDANSIPRYFHVNSTIVREASLAKIYLDGDEILPSSADLSIPNDVLNSVQPGQRIWFLDMAHNKHGDPFGYVLREESQNNIRMFRRIGWFENTTRSSDTVFWTHDTPLETIAVI